jgi:hypothetical protein
MDTSDACSYRVVPASFITMTLCLGRWHTHGNKGAALFITMTLCSCRETPHGSEGGRTAGGGGPSDFSLALAWLMWFVGNRTFPQRVKGLSRGSTEEPRWHLSLLRAT